MKRDHVAPANTRRRGGGVTGIVVAVGVVAAAGHASAQDQWRAGELLPGSIVVFPTEPRYGEEVAGLFRQLGLGVVGVGPGTGMVMLQCKYGDEGLWTKFAAALPNVRAAVQDRGGYPGFGTPPTEMPQPTNDPPSWQYHDLWFLQNTGQTLTENSCTNTQTGTLGADANVLAAWSISQGSSSIQVAVLDSGVDYQHPEFAGRLHTTGLAFTCPSGSSAGHCCTGSPVVCNFGTTATDNNGHGTAVASVLGATADNGVPTTLDEEQYVGVDPSCTIVPMRISFNNIPSLGAVQLALEAIAYEDQFSIRVINMSFSFGPDNPSDPQLVALRDVLDDLKGDDIIVVSISTNLGDGQADVHAPCVWNNTFTVAATDMDDERMDIGCALSGSGESVDFAAPGWGMYAAVCPTSRGCSALFASNYLSGTSGAAPMVTGLVSLMLARADALSITLTWDDVYDLIKDNCNDIGTTPPTEEFGWGRIDAYETLSDI